MLWTIDKPTFTSFPRRTGVLKLCFAVFKGWSHAYQVAWYSNVTNPEPTTSAKETVTFHRQPCYQWRMSVFLLCRLWQPVRALVPHTSDFIRHSCGSQPVWAQTSCFPFCILPFQHWALLSSPAGTQKLEEGAVGIEAPGTNPDLWELDLLP